jgi:hypothetical protein
VAGENRALIKLGMAAENWRLEVLQPFRVSAKACYEHMDIFFTFHTLINPAEIVILVFCKALQYGFK